MNFVALSVVSIVLASMVGCNSTAHIQPPVHTITAMVENNLTRIFWLDEHQGRPEKLTELTLIDNHGQYHSEYRWLDGAVREIQREGDLWVNGKLAHQSLIIRYNTQGLAVYQNYLLDNELLPIRKAKLARYRKIAEQALEDAQQLNKNKQNFFQGYWNNPVFEACGSKDEKKLEFAINSVDDVIPPPLGANDHFMAAIGKVGRKKNTVETIILLANENAKCFKRPVFEK